MEPPPRMQHRRNKSAGPDQVPPSSRQPYGSEGCLSLAARRPHALNLEPLTVPKLPPEDPPYPQTSLDFSSVDVSIDLCFNDVSYSVPLGIFKRGMRQILKGVCGELRAGELTAIVGPSGAGKSSLMDILAGYITSFSGSITVNGKERDIARFKKRSCYIMQDDHLQPLLTVEEAMKVAANLKLSAKISRLEKETRITQILSSIGLLESKNVRTNRLSGGQRKRLAIALELVSNPPVMFFDEPTSGLDSSTSKQCISLLRKLALEGRVIVCTIHQPSALLLEMCDHIYGLADGQCIYQGSVKGIIPYLGQLKLHCPPYHNPADFFLEVATGEYGPQIENLVAKSENGKNNEWRKRHTPISQINMVKHVDQMMANGLMTPVGAPQIPIIPFSPFSKNKYKTNKHLPKSPLIKKPSKTKITINPVIYCQDDVAYPTSFFKQVSILVLRNITMLKRDQVLTYMRFFIHTSIAMFLGILYYQIGTDAQYMMDNFNFLFFTVMFLMFTAFNSMTLTFPLELPIIRREHFNRWYSLKAYFIAVTLSDVPIQMLSTLSYAVITFLLTGQPLEPMRMALYVIMCVLVSLGAQSVGILNGAIFNIGNGVIFGPFFMLPFVMFSGFFVRFSDCHPAFQWVFYISYLKYGLDGIVLSVFGYDREKLPCYADYCHFKYPSKFLSAMDLKNAIYSNSVIALCLLCLIARSMAYFMLKYRLKFRIK